MNYLIITFSYPQCNSSFKLFSIQEGLPRASSCRIRDPRTNGETLGVLEFDAAAWKTWAREQDPRSTENGELLGVLEFELIGSARRAPHARKLIHRLLTVIGEFGSLRA